MNDFEAVCDSFERKCRAGRWMDVDPWLESVTVGERPRLREELLAIQKHYEKQAEESAKATEEITANVETKSYKGGTDNDERLTLTYQRLSRNKQVQPANALHGSTSIAMGTLLQNRYRLVSELGKGGFGVVYLAHDVRLRRDVAVKMLLARRMTSAFEVEAMEQLFTEEAQTAASLHHSAIANIFDIGMHEGFPYLVFEYVAGESFRERLRRHQVWSIDKIRSFVLPIAGALDYAHRLRVVHRDLKPENIRVTINGEYKILDLGLARRFDDANDWRFAGTPAYASPEQAAELPSDGRIDQYSLCVILYEMLTGQRPFRSNDPYKLLDMHLSAVPDHPRNFVPSVSERFAQSILKGLSKNPDHRFASCLELAESLGCDVTTRAFEVDKNEVLLESTVMIRSQMIVGLLRANLVLTPNVLWMVSNDAAREIPIHSIQGCRILYGGRVIEVTYVTTNDKRHSIRFEFPGATSCRTCCEMLSERLLKKPTARAESSRRPIPVLSKQCAERYQVVSHLRVEGANEADCRGKAQVRGVMMDADALLSKEVMAQERERLRNSAMSVVDHRLEQIDSFRKLVFWPFMMFVPFFRWLARLAGSDDSQSKRTHSASYVAIRAIDRDDRRELMTSDLKRELATYGNWMLGFVLIAVFIDFSPSLRYVFEHAYVMLSRTLRGYDADPVRAIAIYFSPLPMVLSAMLMGAWPLIMALSIRIRKPSLLVEPAGITCLLWGLGGYVRLMNSHFSNEASHAHHRFHLVLAFVLFFTGIAIWRIGRRITNIIRYTDPLLVQSRYLSAAWWLSILFGLLTMGIFNGMMRYLSRI